jgi:hypothetical protein
MIDDPDDLRRRADHCQRLAQQMLDDLAVQALEAMALDFRKRADEIEVTNQPVKLVN